jgi:hypothetical protein
MIYNSMFWLSVNLIQNLDHMEGSREFLCRDVLNRELIEAFPGNISGELVQLSPLLGIGPGQHIILAVPALIAVEEPLELGVGFVNLAAHFTGPRV